MKFVLLISPLANWKYPCFFADFINGRRRKIVGRIAKDEMGFFLIEKLEIGIVF